MAEARSQRRLAAILAADIAGYSRLMETDEAGTLARLKAVRAEVIDPKIASFGGRIFKTTGDGALAEFASAVDAVNAAVEVQRALARRNADQPEDRRIVLRVGLSLGDVMVDGDDLYGNGVNVAARMEGLAEPGGICISGNVHEHVANAVDFALEDLGEQQVKNIERPVRAWRVSLDEPRPTADGAELPVEGRGSVPSLGNRPAIAVLPFDNLSGDPDQEYFADGLTEDIITALSAWRSFPVIARNSTFVYKGKATDVRRIAEELGASYVLEGSVRKAGNRVRVAAQLIDAGTGHHVWAENLDRDLVDIFALQDELTTRIAATVIPELERAEPRRLETARPGNLDAWTYVQRGFYELYRFDVDAISRAREMFEHAITLDPTYGRAHAGMAWTYVRHFFLGTYESREQNAAAIIRYAQRAIELDDADSVAHQALCVGHMGFGRFDLGVSEGRHAVELNPSNANAYFTIGMAQAGLGQADEAIENFETSFRINPRDPRNPNFLAFESYAHIIAGRYQQAAEVARAVIQRRPNLALAHLFLAAALGQIGRRDEAQAALANAERLRPGETRMRLDWFVGTGAAGADALLAGLQAAGWSGDLDAG